MTEYKYDYNWANSGGRFQNWETLIHEYEIKKVLELGSWEGMSSVFWAERVDEVHCIDNWRQSVNPEWDMAKAESHFDHNASFHDNIVKLKGDTSDVLSCMRKEWKSYFDMVYVDADHSLKNVVVDTILSYDYVKSGGIFLFDDANYGSVNTALVIIEKIYPNLKQIPASKFQAAYQKL